MSLLNNQSPLLFFFVANVCNWTSSIAHGQISTLTDDQKALHTAKVNELLNMDKFGMVEVAARLQPQQVL